MRRPSGWFLHHMGANLFYECNAPRRTAGAFLAALAGACLLLLALPAPAQADDDATLSALALTDASDNTAIALDPTFAAGTTTYTASVANAVSQVTVTPTLSDDSANFVLQDNADTDITDADTAKEGKQVDLSVGANTIKVKVTAADNEATRTYILTVTRAADATLSGLALTDAANNAAIALDPAFAAGTTTYTASVATGVSRVTVTPTANDNSAAYAIQNSAGTAIADADSGTDGHQVNLTEGANTIKVKVTASDNTTTETYTIAVTRAAAPAALSIADITVSESAGTATFTVTASKNVAETVTVNWAAAEDSTVSAAAGKDFTANTGTVTIGSGARSATFTVAILPDRIDESNETFTVTLSNASPASAATISDGTATGTITDDDAAPVLTVSLDKTTLAETAGQKATVTLSTGTGSTFETGQTILVELEGTASPGGVDYTASGSPLTTTLPAGDRNSASSVAWQFEVEADELDEDNETILVTVKHDATRIGSVRTITITDNDPTPALSVADVSETEGDNLVFTVTLSAESGREVTVNYATANDTATILTTAPGGADYTAKSGTLTFDEGETEKTVTVPTNQDMTDEADEAFKFRLSSAVNALLTGTGARAEATGTIEDNDAPPALSVADESVTEGGALEFEVTLTAKSGKTVTVDYAVADGTAFAAHDSERPAGPDYTAPSGSSLTFAPGVTTKTVRVQTAGDTTDEEDETLTFTLSNAQNALLTGTGADDEATGTIEDNDAPPVLSVANKAADEGDDVTFRIELSAASEKTVSVDYSVDNEDIPGTLILSAETGDFTADTGTATLGPAVTRWNVSADTTEDTTDEADETFKILLTNPVNATFAAPPNRSDLATGTIRNDDPDPTATLVLTPASIRESGTTTTSTITVALSNASEEETEVTVSMAPVAPAVEADYTPSANLELTIAPNSTTSTGTVTLAAVDNTTDAPDKKVTISAVAVNTLGIVQPGNKTLTIEDDEPAPTVELELGETAIREKDAPGVTGDQHATIVKVKLSHRSSEPTVVTITPSANDFTLSGSGRIDIEADALEGTQEVTLTAVDNNTDAPDNVLQVRASAVNDQGIMQPEPQELTIWDDEPAPTVTLELSGTSVSNEAHRIHENATSPAMVTAMLSHPSSEPTTVTVSADGADPKAAQFNLGNATLTIPRGLTESSGMATVTPVNNRTDAPNQVVTLSATAANPKLPEPSLQGDPDDVTLTILDDEDRPTLGLQVSKTTIAENGEAAEVKATLTHPSSEPTTLTLASSAAHTDAGAHTLTGTMLTIPAGDEVSDSAAVVTAVNDDIDTRNQEVTVALAEENGSQIYENTQGLRVPSNLRPQVTIEDDDERGLVWTPQAKTISESSPELSDSLSVALTSEPTANVTVEITSRDTNRLRILANGQQFIGVSRDLTFTPDNWSTPQSIGGLIPIQDTDAANNRVALRHATSGGDYVALAAQDYFVTVIDDDVAATNVLLTVDVTRIGEDDGATQVTVQATTEGTPLTSAVPVSVSVTAGTAAATDYTASPATFTITIPANQSSATETFTLTPTADGLDEDDETIRIAGTTTATVENGPDALAVTPDEITIEDDDTRGVSVSKSKVAPLEGGSDTYEVYLESQPADGNVTVTLTVMGDSDITVSPTELTFTDANWETPQTVTVNSAQDDDSRGDRATVSHTVAGADYGANNVTAASVSVQGRDDDSQGLRASKDSVALVEGSSDTYTIVLNAEPDGTVTVRPVVSGDPDVKVSPNALRFTRTNWNQPQQVTVRADEDDDSEDDRANISHRISGGSGLVLSDIGVTVTDIDQTSTAIVLTLNPESVSEDRGQRTVRVTATLNGAVRNASTSVPVAVRPGTASVTDFQAVPASLAIEIPAGRQSASATFRLTPVRDSVDEDDETVTVSGDPTVLPVEGATFTIFDDDDRGLKLPTTPVRVNEDRTAEYRVALSSEPVGGAVTVTLSVNDNPDVTVFPTVLSFNSATWNREQTVTVTAADDPDGDDDTATVTHQFAGADYAGLEAATLSVEVDDNDRTSRTVQLSLAPERIDEDGGPAPLQITATLDGAARASDTAIDVTVTGGTATAGEDFTDPTVTVTIPANATEGTRTFIFEPTDDDIDEGLGETAIFGSTAAPAGLTVRTATLTIADDDGKGIELSAGPVALSEDPRDADGAGGTYTVALATQPAGGDVRVRIAVSGNRDVTVSPTELTFTGTDWNIPQTVTVRAAHDDDAVDDTAALNHAASGADYGGVRALPLAVEVRDVSVRGVTVSKTETGLDFTEGGSDTYTVRLDTQPTGPVTVTPTVTGDEDVTVRPVRLSFSRSNWSREQTVTVRAAQDLDQTADTATIDNAVSGADYGENDVTASSVAVTVSDDDIPSTLVRLKISSDSVREEGGAQRLTVTAELNAAPETGDTEITLTLGTGTAQATDFVDAGSVTLTIPAGRKSATAQVTVEPTRDDLDEGDGETVRISAAFQSRVSGSSLASLEPDSLDVTIKDNDTRGVTVNRTALTVLEGESETYTVKLDSQPTSDVTIQLTATRDSGSRSVTIETPVSRSLTFTELDWKDAQTVTVSVANDNTPSSPTEARVEHAVSGGGYGTVTIEDVDVTVPGLSVEDRTVKSEIPADRTVTVPEGTPVPARTQVTLSTVQTAQTLSISPVDTAPEELPRGFRTGDAIVDIELEGGATLVGEATVCLPSRGAGRVFRYDESAGPPAWVELDAPDGGSPDGLACGVTEHFSMFAVARAIRHETAAKAWLARFGRTVVDQVLDAIDGRMRAAHTQGSALTIAGQRVPTAPQSVRNAETMRDREARQLSNWLRGDADTQEARRRGTRAVTPRDLLAGSSFSMSGGTADGGVVSLWGGGAVTRFEGRESALALDGEVTSAMLGADWMRSRWTAGLVVSHSKGDGDYGERLAGSEDGDGGKIEASLTGLFPWGRYAVSDRLEAWGATGYGWGELTMKRQGADPGEAIGADLDLYMAAMGLRGTLLDGGSDGFTLTGKTDALAVQTASDRGRSADGDGMAPIDAEATRLRLALEGSRPFALSGGEVLTPRLEIGVRHDGGDAETGFGLDLGGGLVLSWPKHGFKAEVRGRGRLTHESKGFRERGFSGALSWQEEPQSNRGAILNLTQTVDGPSSGGADALLSRSTLEGLAGSAPGADGDDDVKRRRLEVKLGYGFSAFRRSFISTPEVGIVVSDTGSEYSLGWRLSRGGGSSRGGLELLLEGRRSESDNDNAEPQHTIGLRMNARF